MRPKHGHHAFTLIELLTVVAILALLVAILAPALNHAMAIAMAAECMTQLHHVGLAMTQHLVSNEDRFPGLWGPPWTGPEEWQHTWMGKEVFTRCPSPISQEGILAKYLGGVENARKLYRCPGLSEGPLRGGVGSNGMFDYTMIQAFPGARTAAVPRMAEVFDSRSSSLMTVPTPLVVEEDPAYHINSAFVDMGHTSINRLGTWHPGGAGNYIAVDGSAKKIVSGDALGPQCWQWYVTTPSGTSVTLGNPRRYGTWSD